MDGNQTPTKQVDVLGATLLIPKVLGIGHSFFVPALKPKVTFGLISNSYSAQNYKLTYEERIEIGVLGIRIWRVL